jgi:DNA-binding MarR family transcriptional regulator
MADRANLDDWSLLAQFSQMFRTISDTFADQVDIPRGQAMVLCTIVKQDGLTQSEIAEQLSVQGATVTNMLQRLEEAGLVIRRRDAEDNRLVRVYLTEAGHEKENSLNALFGSLQDVIFKGIAEDERIVLRQQLQQIIQNISIGEQG